MTNLLEETKYDIKQSGHEIKDVVYIGAQDGHSCTWPEFEKLADAEYNSGFGSPEVATDLLIVFSDGQYLKRAEYDGSEWWEYNPPIVIPTERKPVKRLIGRCWPSMSDLQDDSDDHHNPGASAQ